MFSLWSVLWQASFTVAIVKQELFIWSINVAYRWGTTASSKMQDGFYLQQEYVFSIFESGNLLLNKGLRCSTVANGRLC